jgi:hypothetical protein
VSDSTLVPLNGSDTANAGGLVIGATFMGFLDRVAPPSSRQTLLADATSILTECNVSTSAPSKTTGLVVGRVQSGKTLSYEAVIALARDNGFALVVVISGISNPLLDQGVRRLRRDLTEADENGWNFLINAATDPQAESTLRSIRDNWSDPSTPSQLKKTAICLLLKHHGRIDAFRDLVARIGWSGQKVLIVDDEADQASLNIAFRRGRESATYRNILGLRNVFPNHAYLQYTATPQAPLLIAITDNLSPDFVRVLEPGSEYVGGADYFGTANGLVKVISDADLAMAGDANGPPPPSLVTALREFLIGSANVLVSGQLETRSMLIHPSRLTAPHATFVRWIKTITTFWRGVVEDGDEHEAASLRLEFERAWTALRSTDPEMASFDQCWANIRFVLRNLQLVEMNTRDNPGTPVIEWDSSKAYVLVGGQALDRGFTVDGLSVTYMSRDPGGWTADTIQQRARFFGYKRRYLGQCRVYLEPSLRDAFEMYVEHEKHMIASLKAIQNGSSSLKEWKRQFLLDPAMRATRQTVVSIPTIAVAPGERWIFDPRSASPGNTAGAALEAVEDALAGLDSVTDQYGHSSTLIPMARLLELIDVVPPAPAPPLAQLRALKLQIARLIDDDPEAQARVFRMRPSIDSARSLTSSGTIQPFQGRSNSYPGDREIIDPLHLTAQIHHFGVRRSRTDTPFADMVTLAFWMPDELADGWLLQDEGP